MMVLIPVPRIHRYVCRSAQGIRGAARIFSTHAKGIRGVCIALRFHIFFSCGATRQSKFLSFSFQIVIESHTHTQQQYGG
jgi:hypothetical protein